jgi:4-amino-4-deoxy-L-arabinose transferase-like glycosyltransferase
MLPLWEGWDEYAHFAFLQHWNDRGTLPRATDRISREIDESMRLVPLARELRWIGPPYLIHDDWWLLPPGERDARMRKLESLPPSFAHQPAEAINGRPFVFYEAQQPPLYYWLTAPALRLAANWPLRERVFLIRLIGVLFTSLAIPFTFLAARNVFSASRAGLYSATCCAALLAVAPGFMINGARAANDSLAAGIAAIFLWLLTREKTHWLALGTVLGAAILAKASLLVLVPILFVLRIRGRWRQMLKAVLLALAIGGWWYARNVMNGVPLTGWQESVPLRTLTGSAVQLIRTGRWMNGAQAITKSFTWFGAWSFMTLRTWMYAALEACALGGMATGLLSRRYDGRPTDLRVPFVFTLFFALAIAGGAAAYNAVHGITGIPGWYLWPAGGAMAILIIAGLGRFSIVFAAMLALTDLFGVAVRMMPYYAGLAPWNHGSVSQFRDAASRLHVPGWLAIAWVIATVAIPLLLLQGRAKVRI